MKPDPGTPFDSVESAHAFVALLSKAVADSRQDVEADVEKASSNAPRRLDALHIALYNLKKLEVHMNQSRRILNDLRSLRRLLLDERTSAAVKTAVKSAVAAAKQATPPPANVTPSNGKAQRTMAA